MIYAAVIGYRNGSSEGVLNKVITQYKEMKKLNNSAKLFLFTYQDFKLEYIDENIRIFVLKSRNWHTKRSNIFNIIEKNLCDGEILYIRYPLADKTLYDFLFRIKNYRIKIFFEFQTIEKNELLGNLSINNFIKYMFELFYRRKCLKLISGGICVTNEIKEYNKTFIENDKLFVVGNGIDEIRLNDRIFDEKKIISNNIILVFVGNITEWSGLEKLFNILDKYNYNVNIEDIDYNLFLNVIGEGLFYEKFKNSYSNNNIIFHGYKKDHELYDILLKSHIGVGSLYPSKRKVKEGSNLKNRLYSSFGLPIIKCDIDTDFDYSDFCVDNELFININETLDDFVDGIRKLISTYDGKPNKLISFTKNELLWETKIQKIMKFIGNKNE